MSEDELTLIIIISSEIADPQTYKQAINSSKNKEWTKVMQKKISDLKNQNI